jgi:tripartite-type tricarboxylate transporter receptor subunit TctC
MPDVPTLREAGYPDINPQSWFGLFTTGGTPRTVVDKVYQDVAAVFAEPEFRERHITLRGFDGVISSPQDFARFIQEDLQQKARLIRQTGLKPE